MSISEKGNRMSKLNKKKGKNNNQNNDRIEQLEPRFMMDFAV
jgi:hypothetical protein